ncbi:S41 family peptidase [Mesorhizobium amorphae]|uniref:S41 family peptidase n=1 Tax=Mesorhizobium amorphae TaxID=71433 RepID=UPI0011851427|nr:S41 family peptidase [Mesorhizobium amorphae]
MAGTDRPVRRWLKRIALVVVAVLIFVIAPAAVILYPTFKSYPQVKFPPAASQAERNRQDLDLLQRLPEVERSFTNQTRSAFNTAMAELSARAPDLDRAGFAMGAARAVALADNGHTSVMALVGGHGFNALPVRFGWFADGLFVVAARPDQHSLLGAQLVGFEGRSPQQLLEGLRAYVGGPANLARELSPNLIASPELLHAAGLAGKAESAALVLRLRDGTQTSQTLAAEPGTPEPLTRTFWPKRYLSPVPVPDDNGSWEHVLQGVPVPPALARPDRFFWHDYPGDGSVLYVQINRVRDQDGKSLHGYLADVLAEAKTRRIRNAVVDLRFNPGGDYTQSADFSKQLPELVPLDGKVLILTSGTTFSAALSTAAMLKYHAGGRGILVGEPMGDRSKFWGEGGNVTLPNSRLAVRYTTAYHDWEDGCGLAQVTTCFFLNYVYGTPSGSLVPAIPVAQAFASYAAGEDAVLAEALKQAK